MVGPTLLVQQIVAAVAGLAEEQHSVVAAAEGAMRARGGRTCWPSRRMRRMVVVKAVVEQREHSVAAAVDIAVAVVAKRGPKS